MQANEICPGLTFEQHAESLAMWELHKYVGPGYKEYVNDLAGAWYLDLTDDLAVLQPYHDE